MKLTSFRKRENSTRTPGSFEVERDCYLKAPSSVINPVLVFDRKTLTAEYNYCYIPEFKRYYFVTEYVYTGALLEYHLSVDVLATFRNTIGGSSQYVLRSAYEWDGNVVDSKYPTKANPTSEVTYISNPWSAHNPSGGCYCFGIAGSGNIDYYVMSYGGLEVFIGYLLSDAYVNAVLGNLTVVDPSLKLAVDPLQYITSCIWLPFSISGLSGTITGGINVGFANVPDAYCTGVRLSSLSNGNHIDNISFTQKDHPQAGSRGNYVNSGAYTNCSIYLPPYGMIDLDCNILAADRGTINVSFNTDIRTGECLMKVSIANLVPAQTHIVGEYRFRNCVNVPLTQVVSAGGMIGLADVVGPAVGVATAAITGNAAGVAAGMITGAVSAIQTAAKNRIPEVRRNGNVESMIGFYDAPFIQYTWEIQVDDDVAQHGRPLCKVRQLSNIPGYILCANTELAIAGTAEEEVRIRGYLESGFFYE